ncbi:efflux RND transporter permease subunit, partial [Escherichia coli]
EYSASVANDLRTYFTKQPEIQKVSVQIGRPDDGTDSTGVFNQEYGLYFAPPDQWAKGMTKGQLVERLSKHLEKIPGIEYNFSQYIQDNVDEALSGVKGENSVKLFGNDLNVLEAKANEIQAQLKKVQGLVDVG